MQVSLLTTTDDTAVEVLEVLATVAGDVIMLVTLTVSVLDDDVGIAVDIVAECGDDGAASVIATELGDDTAVSTMTSELATDMLGSGAVLPPTTALSTGSGSTTVLLTLSVLVD